MTRYLLTILLITSVSAIPVVAGSAWGAEGSVHKVVVPRNVLKLVPAELEIKAGDSILWTNSDSRKHNLASVPGSGTTDKLEIFSVMEPGDTFSHTFSEPGEYPYFCFIHNQMTGHITVTE